MVAKAYFGGANVPGVSNGAFHQPRNPFQGPQHPYVQRLGPTGSMPAAPRKAVKPKVLTIPTPDSDGVSFNKTVMLNEIDWPLFNSKDGSPRPEDVRQNGVANCALASIIAALAYTPRGRMRLKKMISEHKKPTLSKHVGNHFQFFTGPKEVTGKRYFTVTFPGKNAVNVSSVFYSDEASPPGMIYMESGNPKVLWPCVLEKAYAKLVGGYHKFSENPEVVWKDVVGSQPKYLNLQQNANPKVPDRTIIRQAAKSNNEPMIAAAAAAYHGVVVKRSSGNDSIIVWDQYDYEPKNTKKSIERLRQEETVLYYDQL